ncbi:MAG: MFS transporter [Lachnospiraceae bacterium]|nr:MFS transporter [Lachnospiraceae bacterium]
MSESKERKFEYKWVIMAVCILMIFTALGFCSSNKDLFLKPITQALGLDRAGFSLADTCRYIATAVVNLFFSALVVKWGAKKMSAFGFAALIGYCLVYSFATEYWHFYIGGALLGVGLAWSTTTIVGYVVNNWFSEKRGTIMGIILASNGLGAAIFAPIIRPVITAEPFGYRTAYRYIGVAVLAFVMVLILIFMKTAPDKNAAPAPAKKGHRGAKWEGIEFRDAVKSHRFYFAAVCIFLTGAALQAISGIKSSHLSDVGLEQFVTMTASFYAIFLALSKILAGVCFDRLGLRITMLLCEGCAAVSIFMLAILNASTPAPLVFVTMALLAMAMPLETIMLPLIAAGMFGEKSYTKMLGLFVSINTAGYAVGAPLVNLVWDKTGSYKPILLALSGVLVLITVCFQIILKNKKGKAED